MLAGATAARRPPGAVARPEPDAARGKELFTQKLRRLPHPRRTPGTKGVQGPNLDLAFKQSIADGLGRSTIEGVVENQIDLPQGNQMPADLYEGKDARRVWRPTWRARSARPAEGGGGGPSGTAEADAQNVVSDPGGPERSARLPVQERRRPRPAR